MKNSLFLFAFVISITFFRSTPLLSQETSPQNRDTCLAISEKKITLSPEQEESNTLADSSSDESSVAIDSRISDFIYQTPNLSSPSSKNSSLHDDCSSPLIEKSAPPTQHPIERKTIKAITGYTLGFAAFFCGIQTGVSLSTYLGLSFGATIGVSLPLGLLAGAITIHYTWDSINSLFSK